METKQVSMFLKLALGLVLAFAGMFAHATSTSQVTGLPELDSALQSGHPWGLLPFWYGYPWAAPQIRVAVSNTWTAAVVKDLQDEGRELVNSNPDDIGWYCPNYIYLTQEERVIFWLRFISVLTEEESGYNTNASMNDTAVGKNVWSTGMLSLSTTDHCDGVKTINDLKDWNKNFACGVKIMTRLMQNHSVISWYDSGWQGIGDYWGPLRNLQLKTSAGRELIVQYVEKNRPAWLAEAASGKNPAYEDEHYRYIHETKFERMLRLMNEMPFCN